VEVEATDVEGLVAVAVETNVEEETGEVAQEDVVETGVEEARDVDAAAETARQSRVGMKATTLTPETLLMSIPLIPM
jgi:hypothetical protein